MSNHIEIEEWIKNALAVLKLSDRRMETVESERVLSAAQRRFVHGAPRVWWLGFGAINSSQAVETSRLSSLVEDSDEIGWFIPETEGGGNLVYRLTAKEVEAVVEDCPFFEYYFLDAGEQRLIAETDHNQFVIASPVPDSLT
jgi:hypothetical protein